MTFLDLGGSIGNRSLSPILKPLATVVLTAFSFMTEDEAIYASAGLSDIALVPFESGSFRLGFPSFSFIEAFSDIRLAG